MNIGTGGEGNWVAHTKSNTHQQRNTAAKQNNQLSGWLVPKPRLTGVPAHPPSPTVPTPTSATNPPQSHDTDPQGCIPPAIAVLLGQLRYASQQLPESVPLASENDVLAQFSMHLPMIGDDNEPSQILNQALQSVFRYQATIEELAPLVRRGSSGIEGLCDWFEKCGRKFRQRADLLIHEDKLERLLKATER